MTDSIPEENMTDIDLQKLTDTDLRKLREEAAEAGDLEQVLVCNRAIRGDQECRKLCREAIAAASAQSEPPEG